MKVAVFDKFIGYNVGGAQRSLHALLQGVDLDIFYYGCEVKKAFQAGNYRLSGFKAKRIRIIECPRLPYFEYWLNRRKIKVLAQNLREETLLTQGMWGAVAARYFPGKAFYFIRDEYHLNKLFIYQTGIKKFFKYIYLFFQLPFIWQFFRDNRLAIARADMVIANSEFIGGQVKKIFNKQAKVIYPIINIKKMLDSKVPDFDSRKYITCIGQELIKGRTIVEQIAKAMPEQKFMIVGRGYSRREEKGNIVYQPWQNDVLEIYKKTKILLVPSICAEAFGRTAIEAMALCIPALGSSRGGIPEALPAEWIIQDLFNIDEWREKITDLLGQDKNYRDLFREHVLKFDQETQINNFKSFFHR